MIKKVCNKCGQEMDFWDLQEDFSIHKAFGYGTRYDGYQLNLNLCCGCMESLIKDCVINPVVGNEEDE